MLNERADRPLVRGINRASILARIRVEGPVTRSAIARATGVSTVTVRAITAELLSYGLIEETDGTPSGRGRPAGLLQLVPSSFHAVGIKLMEGHLVGAVTDLHAAPIAELDWPLEGRSPEDVVEGAARLVERLHEQAGADRSRLLGVGIGMAGVVDGAEGVCRHSPFFGWRDVPVAAMASKRIGAPVLVENDVNTLALAERWFGAGHDVDDFLLVTVGRGIGLGIVSEGRLHRGARGGAGEFGHTVVDSSNTPCACGNVGCLEASVAEPALLDAARILRGGDGRPQTIDELYALALAEPKLEVLLRQAGSMLGRGLTNLVNVLAPSLVILSGEGVRAGDMLIDAAREELGLRVSPGLRDSFRLVVEPLPDAAWARGAASLVLGEIFDVPVHGHSDLLWGREAVPLARP